jgi:hypothetical protein
MLFQLMFVFFHFIPNLKFQLFLFKNHIFIKFYLHLKFYFIIYSKFPVFNLFLLLILF